jgi:glutamate formiminotransferase
VGARSFLIAYNVYLNQPDIAAARAVAREIRSANGGLHGVKAIGVLCEGRAQVAMNITDYRITPMHTVHARVQELAHKHGASTAEGELIGLIPQDAYDPAAAWVREIPSFQAEAKVLEQKLRNPMDWPSAEA